MFLLLYSEIVEIQKVNTQIQTQIEVQSTNSKIYKHKSKSWADFNIHPSSIVIHRYLLVNNILYWESDSSKELGTKLSDEWSE